MKHFQFVLLLSIFVMSIVACENVILPESNTNPAKDLTSVQDDSTGNVESDGTDNTVEPSETPLANTFTISGLIVNEDAGVQVDFGAPENTYVVVAWWTGEDYIAFGNGVISDDRTTYTLTLTDDLPGDLLYGHDETGLGKSFHGFGTVYLTSVDYADGEIMNLGDLVGGVVTASVIYNSGQEGENPLSSPWLDAFDDGYSMGHYAMGGAVPAAGTEFAIVY